MPRAARSRILPSLAAAGLAIVVQSAACSSGAADAPAAAAGGRGGRGAAAGPILVTTTEVAQKPMAVTLRAVGNVEAASTVDVRAQVTGALMSIGFTEGQDVTAGQLLFTLDSRPFDVALKQAEATRARDTASLQNAQAQLARVNDLFKRGLVARSDFDTSTAQAAALEATVSADNAIVDNARLQLQYTRITSPVSGRTGALLVHEGLLIRANDAAPLVVINQMAPVHVSVAVPARLLPELRAANATRGLPVTAAPAGGSRVEANGTVTFIDNAVDPASDTVRVKATFPNKDRLLWPGAFVDATLQLSVNPRALVVPTSAVLATQQGQMIYVVKADQTVELRPVKVAFTEGTDVVIATGVTAGEVIVTDGQLRLTPGARVTTKAAAGATPRTTP